MTRPLSAALALLLAAAGAPPARAGVYPAAPPVPFASTDAGVATELPLEPQFLTLLNEQLTLQGASPASATSPERARLSAARDRLDPRGSPATQLERATLSLALGDPDDAVNLLQARTRDRIPDFVALVTLSQAYARRGDWAEATRTQASARLDAEPPPQLPGATAGQTKWLVRVEREVAPLWLRRHAEDSAARGDPAAEPVIDLFGVKFVGDSGAYEPGKLAAAERARLPADAVATVQQLLLWNPLDTRLLWLLAELYQANGQLRESAKLFDQCTWGRNYTNRAVLMGHRQVVREAASKLPAEREVEIADAPAVPTPAQPDPAKRAELVRKLAVVGAAVLALGLLMVALQLRAWRRRWPRK